MNNTRAVLSMFKQKFEKRGKTRIYLLLKDADDAIFKFIGMCQVLLESGLFKNSSSVKKRRDLLLVYFLVITVV